MGNTMENTSENLEKLISEYINHLDEFEKIALEVAKEQLESSFSIEKSIGFLKWKENKDK
jgi:rubrerythrin